MHRPIHPLTGADLRLLRRLLADNGWPAARYLPTLALAAASAAARAPLAALETRSARRARPRTDAAPPVFIVGHWRSGTTHLFNLLSAGSRAAYATPVAVGLPGNFRQLGRVLRPVLERAIPRRRGIDAMAVTPESPQEDELALASLTVPSFYHGVYFPRRFARHMAAGLFFDGCDAATRAAWQRTLRGFTEKVARDAPDGRVLVKNPAHTGRIDALREIWPDARFVHVVRDPHAVLQSTRRMFADLLAMLALQPHDPAVVERTILASYPRMLDRLDAHTADLPPERFAEVRFEDLEQAPLDTVRRLAGQLALGDPETAAAGAERHLATVAGHRKQTRAVPPEVADTVARHWDAQRARWGYPRRDGGRFGGRDGGDGGRDAGEAPLGAA